MDNRLRTLLVMKTSIADHVHMLSKLEDAFITCIQPTLDEVLAFQSDVDDGCKKMASLNPLKRVSEQDVYSLQQRKTRMERLIDIIKDEYARYVEQRNLVAEKAVTNKIARFIDAQKHVLEFYGFVSCCSDEHLVLAQGMEGQLVTMPHEDRLKHLYMNGLTGSGKSRQLESMVFQTIILGQGGMLMEPLGELTKTVSALVMCYENMRRDFPTTQAVIADFIAHVFDSVPKEVQEKVRKTPLWEKFSLFEEMLEKQSDTLFPPTNVTIVDLSADSCPFHINPFVSDVFSIEEIVQVLLDCIALEMGVPVEQTPQAANVLSALFTLVSANKGTINDLLVLFTAFKHYQGQGKRGAVALPDSILENMKNSGEAVCRNYLNYLEETLLSFSGNAYGEMTNSSRNRLSNFLNSKLCDDFFNCSESSLDLPGMVNSCEERQPFMLVHVPCERQGSGIVSHYLYRVISKLLYSRNQKQRKSKFYWFIDEFVKFLGSSKHSATMTADVFTSVRQYGCGLCVALQHSGQTKLHDPSGHVFESVVSNSFTTLCFRSSPEDARFFAESLWNNKGNLVEMSYTINNGETRVLGINQSLALNSGWNASHSSSKTLTESSSKAIGHTVTESTNSIQHNSHTDMNSKSNGEGHSKSLSEGQQSRFPHRYQHITESKGTVINASHHNSETVGKSSTFGNSEGRSNGQSNSETCTTGNSESKGEGDSFGISESTSKTMGATQSLSCNTGYGRTLRRFPVAEEERLIAQEVRKQADRELFVSSGQTLTKAVTLDALSVKLKKQLEPILDDYYNYLNQFQAWNTFEIELSQTAKVESEEPLHQEQVSFAKPKNGIDIGTGDIF